MDTSKTEHILPSSADIVYRSKCKFSMEHYGELKGAGVAKLVEL